MSSKDLSSLSHEDLTAVKHVLLGLVATLQSKKAAAGGKLITDEESVLSALTHPERGDVVVYVLNAGETGRPLEVLLSNKRDPTTPFAIMDLGELRRHPDRRAVDGSRPEPKAGRVALFLASQHDLDAFRLSAQTRVESYSTHFQLYEPAAPLAPPAEQDLKTKPLDRCTVPEKWTIYKRDWDFDPRRDVIEKELFSFPISYAKHNSPKKEAVLLLAPGKFGQNLGQLIRDVYPVGVRTSLRRDFPADHRAKLAEVYSILEDVRGRVLSRKADTNGPEYDAFLQELADLIGDIEKADPELMRV